MNNYSKNILFLTIIISLITSIASCKGQNGKVITQNRNSTPYSKIQVSDGWNLILEQGDEYSIKITTNENLLDGLKTEVVDDVLIIYSTSNAIKSEGIRKNIYLKFIELSKITANKDSDISSKTKISSNNLYLDLDEDSDFKNITFNGDKLTAKLRNSSKMDITFESIKHLDIEAASSCDIKLEEVKTETFNIVLSNDSEAKLYGFTKTFNAQASQESEIKAKNLRVTNCLVNLSSDSEAELNVKDSLYAKLTGESELELKGTPNTIKNDICKSCEFKIN
jgi:hypothetical protein